MRKQINKKHLSFIPYVFAFIVIAIAFIIFSHSQNAQIIVAFFAVSIAVVTFAYEIHRSKNLAEADFIVNLNQTFVTNDDYKAVYEYCEHPKNHEPPKTSQISNYLTFFETFYLLYERGILKMSMVNDLFGYRFFLVIYNPTIQAKKLSKVPDNFHNILKLEKLWLKYRKSKKMPFYQLEGSIPLIEAIGKEKYKAIVGKVRDETH